MNFGFISDNGLYSCDVRSHVLWGNISEITHSQPTHSRHYREQVLSFIFLSCLPIALPLDVLCCYMKEFSFHSFPLNNKVLLKEWLSQIKRENFLPTKHSKLCSEHFEEDCFIYQNFTGRRLLKRNAVPTKFSFSKTKKQRKKNSYQMR